MRAVELGACGCEDQPQDAVACKGVAAFGPLLGDRAASRKGDFDGPDDLGRVVGMDQAGSFGVEAGKRSMEMGGTSGGGALCEEECAGQAFCGGAGKRPSSRARA